MRTIILISGKKRAGKDTVAQMIVEQLQGDYSVSRLSFAEPMKEILADTFDIQEEFLDLIKNDTKTYQIDVVNTSLDCDIYEHTTDMRQILQRFGTEAMKKQFGDDVWSELLYKKIHSDITVVSDWRFKSELEYLKKQKGVKLITVSVNRPELVHTDTHISEKDLDDVKCDYVLQNTSDIDTLKCQIDALLTSAIVPCEYPDYPFSYFGGIH